MNSSDERGFTLLEVLVALVILILGIGAFYQAFGSGLLAEAAAQREQRSAEVAAHLLAGLGRSQMLQDGLTNGELPNGYRWTLHVESFTPTDLNGQSPTVEGHLATLDVQEMGRAGAALRIQTIVLGVASQ
jgi:prepilin-type N-terminal cleavage/methylation domain-containing protein